MKKIPNRPPRSEAESALLIQEEGKLISKAPRNDAANKTKMAKKKILTPTLLAKPLRAWAPKAMVMRRVRRS